MIPDRGVEFTEIHSTGIVETGDEFSIWLSMSDGSIVGCYIPIADLIQRGNTIWEAEHAPTHAVLQ